MEPLDYLVVLRKQWATIAALTALLGATGFAASVVLPPKYEASSSVFVSTPRGTSAAELVQGATYTQNLVQSYAQLATMPTVLEPVIDDLKLSVSAGSLASRITAVAPLDTVIIEITAEAASGGEAAQIANAVAASLAARVAELSPKGADGESAVTLAPTSTASAPLTPSFPNPLLLTVLGVLGGLALGVLYALGRHVLDTRINGETGLRRITDLPVLARVARHRRGANGITMRADPHSLAAEEYRRLRTNLEFSSVDRRVRSVLVTSSLPGEGKSTTSLNFAMALAERSGKVLLIDADLRNPTVADFCQLDGSVGLTSVLVGSATLREAIQEWGDTGLQVLPAGVVPPNPNQLLASGAMAALLDNLTKVYDYVVIDTPPLIPVTDALTLARLADGVVLVVRDRATRRQEAARSLESLQLVGAPLLGIALTHTTDLTTQSYYGYQPDASSSTEVLAPVARIARLRAPALPPRSRTTPAGTAEARDAATQQPPRTPAPTAARVYDVPSDPAADAPADTAARDTAARDGAAQDSAAQDSAAQVSAAQDFRQPEAEGSLTPAH